MYTFVCLWFSFLVACICDGTIISHGAETWVQRTSTYINIEKFTPNFKFQILIFKLHIMHTFLLCWLLFFVLSIISLTVPFLKKKIIEEVWYKRSKGETMRKKVCALPFFDYYCFCALILRVRENQCLHIW